MSYREDNCVSCDSKSQCFKGLSVEELERIDANRVCLKYKKGEVIIKQGSIVNQIHYVKQGLTKIYKEINDSNNLILNFFPTGALIGLPAVFGENVSQYSVAAVKDTVICSISKEDFENFIRNNVKFATAVISTINNCNLYNFGKIVSLTQKQLSGRIAETLLFLADDIYQSDRFRMSLTRKDIAEFTGMSVMSVIRILKELNQDGIIEFSAKDLHIIDKKRLQDISDKA